MVVLKADLKRTRFSDKIKEHPVLFFIAVSVFVLFAATGYSTCAISYKNAVLTKTVLLMEYGTSYNVFAGIIRAVCVYALFYVLISLVGVHRLFLLSAVVSFAIYGFVTGFTASAFFYEFEWWGVLYGAIFIAPNIMAATAMMLCLLRCFHAQKRISKNTKIKAKLLETDEKNGGETTFGRELMLLFFAIGIEGVVIPLTLRILLY